MHKLRLATISIIYVLCVFSQAQATDLEKKLRNPTLAAIFEAVMTNDISLLDPNIVVNPRLFVRYKKELLSPLELALRLGRVHVAAFLVQRGANVNQDKGALIRQMVEEDNLPAVTFLLDNDANAQVIDDHGRTLLMIATCTTKPNSEEIMRLLIKNGVNIGQADREGDTVMTFIIGSGHSHFIPIFHQMVPDIIHRPNSDGETPLFPAAHCRDEEAFAYLLETKADVNHADLKGRTPLFCALGLRNYHSLDSPFFDQEAASSDIIKRLIQAKADVNHTNTSGLSPLHELAEASTDDMASRHQLCQAIQILIDAKADVHLKRPYKNGLNPCEIAFDTGHYDALWILSSQDPDKRARVKDRYKLISYDTCALYAFGERCRCDEPDDSDADEKNPDSKI